jgi:hypothetical protein
MRMLGHALPQRAPMHLCKKRLFPELIQIYYWRSSCETHEQYNSLIKSKWIYLKKIINSKWNYLQKIIKGPASLILVHW